MIRKHIVLPLYNQRTQLFWYPQEGEKYTFEDFMTNINKYPYKDVKMPAGFKGWFGFGGASKIVDLPEVPKVEIKESPQFEPQTHQPPDPAKQAKERANIMDRIPAMTDGVAVDQIISPQDLQRALNLVFEGEQGAVFMHPMHEVIILAKHRIQGFAVACFEDHSFDLEFNTFLQNYKMVLKALKLQRQDGEGQVYLSEFLYCPSEFAFPIEGCLFETLPYFDWALKMLTSGLLYDKTAHHVCLAFLELEEQLKKKHKEVKEFLSKELEYEFEYFLESRNINHWSFLAYRGDGRSLLEKDGTRSEYWGSKSRFLVGKGNGGSKGARKKRSIPSRRVRSRQRRFVSPPSTSQKRRYSRKRRSR